MRSLSCKLTFQFLNRLFRSFVDFFQTLSNFFQLLLFFFNHSLQFSWLSFYLIFSFLYLKHFNLNFLDFNILSFLNLIFQWIKTCLITFFFKLKLLLHFFLQESDLVFQLQNSIVLLFSLCSKLRVH